MKLWFECWMEHWLHWVCSMWWVSQQQTSMTGRNGEAVCIVTENVSGQCVPHIWIHVYASDEGDSSRTVVCFDLGWETGHPDRYFAGLLPQIRLQSLLCPVQIIVHWSSYVQHYTVWFMSYGCNCRRWFSRSSWPTNNMVLFLMVVVLLAFLILTNALLLITQPSTCSV
jgi:hypothetical protein